MLDEISLDSGVSPVVGVILMVAVTVILSTVVGLFATGLSDNTQENAKAGVTVSDNGDGSVDVQAISIDRADEIRVLVDGTQKATITDAGGTSTVPGGAITVVGVLDEDKTVLQTVPETETSTPPETVSGTVRVNPPIDGATVKAIDTDGSVIEQTTTNATGEYQLSSSDPYIDNVLVNVEGFENNVTNPLYTSAKLPVETSGNISVDFDETETINTTVNGTEVSVVHRGTGTSSDPHTVGNLHQLQAIDHSSATRGDSYELIDDIDASETTNWNSGAGFEPIGGPGFFERYSGSFDGDNHAVDSLFIDRTRFEVGLFGSSNGTIENIAVTNASINATENRIGGLVGRNDGGTVSDSYASGDVSGASDTGGLIGKTTFDGQVSNSSASVKVVSDDRDVGGLVGRADGPVSNSFATGNVSGRERAGGLIGTSTGPVSNSNASGDVSVEEGDAGGLIGSGQSVSNSSATGDVSANGVRVGGLVGNNDGKVSDSFATGNVSGANREIGGLVGIGLAPISDSFATGDVNGANDTGGLVGESTDPVSNSFATGDVNGANGTGGLVGKNDDTVSNSSATGEVSGNNEVGGLIGISDGTVSNSSASGEVRGDTNVGGLVGDNADFRKFEDGKGTIANSFSTGTVSAETNVGGLIGNRSGDVTESYWDTQATNQSTSAGDGTGLTTSEMQGSDAETNMNGFDFTNVWKPVEGDYPELRE